MIDGGRAPAWFDFSILPRTTVTVFPFMFFKRLTGGVLLPQPVGNMTKRCAIYVPNVCEATLFNFITSFFGSKGFLDFGMVLLLCGLFLVKIV